MKLNTNGKDQIAGGKIYQPDEEGNVTIPDDIARSEGLLKEDAPKADPELEALVDEAVTLGVLGPDGKKAPPSVLRKWAKERLAESIAEAKRKAEDDKK